MSEENDKEKDVVEQTRRTYSNTNTPTANIFKTNSAQLNHKSRSEGVQNPLAAIAIVAAAMGAVFLLCWGIIKLFF